MSGEALRLAGVNQGLAATIGTVIGVAGLNKEQVAEVGVRSLRASVLGRIVRAALLLNDRLDVLVPVRVRVETSGDLAFIR